jgi:hypothetical protein
MRVKRKTLGSYHDKNEGAQLSNEMEVNGAMGPWWLLAVAEVLGDRALQARGPAWSGTSRAGAIPGSKHTGPGQNMDRAACARHLCHISTRSRDAAG